MIRRAAILLALIALAVACDASDRSVRLRVQGRERRYVLHVPPHVPAHPPLVIAFHGGSQTPEEMRKESGFDALADREGFLVVYPEAVGKNWNDGRGTMASAQEGVDDVAFTRRIIDDVRSRYAIDARRIDATGPSNGGMFSNRLGCEMAGTFAAIGPVIGPMATNLVAQCRPSEPISVIGISGVDDPLMPFAGGEEGGTMHLGRGGRIEGSRATQSFWARVDGCAQTAIVTKLPAIVADGTSVVKRQFPSCRDGIDVVWYEVQGGGHRWFGHEARAEGLIGRVLGKTSRNLDATTTLWEFFKTHPKR
ncbi:MAG TPA: PHB depolymerase family esterase [Vicinamibacterales bacterium]